MRNLAQAYVAEDLKCQVLSASPHQLITMLFEGALMSLSRAQVLLEHHDKVAAGTELSRAADIITEGLMGSLEGVGTEKLADDLYGLYVFCATTLLAARVSGDIGSISHVHALLNDIAQAWREIGTRTPSAQTADQT